MQYYLIKPRDPLIIRSGRPFDEISDAKAARFPPPSTVAGALRNIYARSTGKELNKELLKLKVIGPLAVKLDVDGSVSVLVPKPADVQYFREQSGERKRFLAVSVPTNLKAQEGCNLPEKLMPLMPVLDGYSGKPISGPSWWSLEDLKKFRKGEKLSFEQVQRNGWTPAEPDIRTHIMLKDHTKQAEEGMIFQTTGLTMWQKVPSQDGGLGRPFPTHSIALLAGIDGDIPTNTYMNLGGERRLAEIESAQNLWPECPESLAKDILETLETKRFTLTLLTPALFEQGWLPAWIDPDTFIGNPPSCGNLTVKLFAAAVERWIPQSGWDLDKRQPRAAQKMTPAGATYWFEILEGATEENIKALWFTSMCDPEQSEQYPNHLSGFGLALPAAYRSNHS